MVHIEQFPLVSMAVTTVPVASIDTETMGDIFSWWVVTYHPVSLIPSGIVVFVEVGVVEWNVSFVVDDVVLLSTIVALVVASLITTCPLENPHTTMYIV